MTTLDSRATQVIDGLDRDGFAVLEGYLDPDEVRAKKDELERVLETTRTGRDDFEGLRTRRVYALFAKTRCFDAQAIDPFVLEIAERVIGPQPILNEPHAISIGPGETEQGLHHDDDVYPLPRPHAELVFNTMWALDDFTVENGATRVVPGSHRGETGDAIPAVMPAGSVMFFVGGLHHGGGANTTDRSRLGVVLSYCAGWLRPQENHMLGVPRETVRTLDPKLQELLGYGLHGVLGGADGRHPRKFL